MKFNCTDARCHFHLETDTKEILNRKNLSFSPLVFEKSFDKVPTDAVLWMLGN